MGLAIEPPPNMPLISSNIKHPSSITARCRFTGQAHPTPQHLFTNTDLGGYVRHRPTGLHGQAGASSCA